MKLRSGFVSNSSSSSFTLTAPKGMTKESIRAILENMAGDMTNSIIPNLKKILVDTIMECMGEKIDLAKELKWEIDYISKNKENKDSCTEERDSLIKKIESGLDYYRGGFSDNSDMPFQTFLCNTNFEVEKDGVEISNKGGY